MKIAFRNLPWLLVVFLISCDHSSVGEQIGPSWPNVDSKVHFSDRERTILREHGMVVYRGKLILEAQPPVTADQIDEIQSYLADTIPDDLLGLWELSFGGALDYDYEIYFGDHIYPASLREIFYKDSDHYHDIVGWIEEESGGEPDLWVVPFAGFEYLERVYAVLEGPDRGKVLYWAQGLPAAWKGRLNQDSITIPARSVSEVFDQLYLSADPFEPPPEDSYPNGLEMVEKVRELEVEFPELASKVAQVIRENVFDWRVHLPRRQNSGTYSAIQRRAMRLALIHAASEDDVSVVDEFEKLGLPLDLTLQAESGLLPVAMRKGSVEVVGKIIISDLDVGDSVVIHIDGAGPEIVRKLIERGTRFDIASVLNLAEQGTLEAALQVVTSDSITPGMSRLAIAEAVEYRADREEKSANDIEEGRLISYATAAEHRENASNLRAFLRMLSE